ncbi:E3 ubiquitin-protein ligase SDIR1 [Apostasia shenzhenica]|uniref:E3 ubiquitin-protein ligase SDIR1 n=1 Tax=Apostasia shenzhenica TaxID=1088818 RepID=A0A2I0AK81_9ASPA|nr:E3 ubiquitin-protein ligase SDIR1 [Apostasia shenzhenica]
MASAVSISDFIQVTYERVHHSDVQGPPEKAAAGDVEPNLEICFTYVLTGETDTITNVAVRRLAEHSCPSYLRDFLQTLEPLPLDSMVDPEEVGPAREMISDFVAQLVRECDGVEGLDRLVVEVVVWVGGEEGEGDVLQAADDGDDEEDEDVEFLVQRRMSLVGEEVYRGEGGSGGGDEGAAAGEKKKTCAVCLEDAEVGEVLVRTPCVHLFHGGCLRRWFQTAGFCPLCRFSFDP